MIYLEKCPSGNIFQFLMVKQNACDIKVSFHASLTPSIDVWHHSLLIPLSFLGADRQGLKVHQHTNSYAAMQCHLNLTR